MIRILRKLTGVPHIYPFYHLVSDSPPAHVRHLFRVKTVREFEADLEFFLKYYEPADFPDILNQRKPSFHLSFDDGLRECYDIIAPILLKKGIPATFFVNSHFVDNQSLFYKHKISLIFDNLNSKNKKQISNLLKTNTPERFIKSLKYSDTKTFELIFKTLEIDEKEYLATQKPYMTSTQLSDLQKLGFQIGAHSATHPLYSEITLNEQINETKQSLDFITKTFKIPNPTFAFPFSDDGVSLIYFHTFKNTVSFGTAGIKLDSVPTNIQRIAVERMPFAGDYVQKRYLEYILQKIVSKNKISRK